MSGLSNWALNQRIYSVAARSRGGGSTNSTISDVLTNGNDAGNKAITNLSNVSSTEVTTSKVKSTAALELGSNGNTVTIGATGKLTLRNPSGAGILCQDSSNIVEKVSVGSNLAYDTSTKTLNTATALTGLTSVSSDGVTTNTITFPSSLLQKEDGGNQDTQDQHTNLENLFKISILDTDGNTITPPNTGGLLMVDRKGRVTVSQSHTNLSVNANFQTITASNPSAYISYIPSLYTDEGTTSIVGWDTDVYYLNRGSQLWLKGKLTVKNLLSLQVETGRDDTINSNYMYTILNASDQITDYVIYEDGTTEESNYTGRQLGSDTLGSKYNIEFLNKNTRDYNQNHVHINAAGNLEVYETGQGEPTNLIGHLVNNTIHLEAYDSFPVYYAPQLYTEFDFNHEIMLVVQQWGIYIWEPNKRLSNYRARDYSTFIVHSSELNYGEKVVLNIYETTERNYPGTPSIATALGTPGVLTQYTTNVYPTTLAGNNQFGIDLTNNRAINGQNIFLTKPNWTNTDYTSLTNSSGFTTEYKLSSSLTLDHNTSVKFTPTRHTISTTKTNFSTSIDGVYTTYASGNGTTTRPDLSNPETLKFGNNKIYMSLPSGLTMRNPFGSIGNYIFNSASNSAPGLIRSATNQLLYLAATQGYRNLASHELGPYNEDDVIEFDCMMEVNP